MRLNQRNSRSYKTYLSCSTKLSVELSLLINMNMPTTAGIFIIISREIFMHGCIARKNLQLLVI